MVEGEGPLDMRIHKCTFVNIGPPTWPHRHDHGVVTLESAEEL